TGNGSAGIFVRGGGSSGGQHNRLFGNAIGLSDYFALGCAGGEGNRVGILVGAGAIATNLSGNIVGCSAQDGISIDGSDGAPVDTVLDSNAVGVNLAPAAVANGWAGVSVLAGALRTTLDHNRLSGNVQQGVFVTGAATGQITLTANIIGLNPLGTFSVPNGQEGIRVVGLPSAAMTVDRNTVSGNAGSGISLDSSADITVANNFIGVDGLGATAWPNGGDGVALTGGANHNLIGGTQAAAKNIISGNLGSGVLLDGAATTLNQVSGNYIGLNQAGLAAIPNAFAGVQFDHGAHHNLLGSLSLITQRNVVSGNTQDGVSFLNGAHDNQVDGNYIGLDQSGTRALGNGQAGVSIVSSPANIIGDSAAVPGQYISGNATTGVYVAGSSDTTIGLSNLIGQGLYANRLLGNSGHGIWLKGSNNSRVDVWWISYSDGAGVAVTGAATGNSIIVHYNFGNGGLPIDLGDDGPTPNDPGDGDSGPNNLLNYPLITGQVGTTATGSACANCTVHVYRAVGNPAAPGGGGVLLNSTVANGAGIWSISGLPAGLSRFELSATACAGSCIAGNTSEMSPRWALSLPLVLR
ncbi:MAG: right-handed parallel beta-helix repeat-containing protein, partial [Anaerolineales bacterium]